MGVCIFFLGTGRRLWGAVALIAWAVVGAGLAFAQSAASPGTISPENAWPGNAWPGNAVPARLISLAPAITETLFALGLGERVVGVSSYCDYPPAATRLPKVGTFTGPVAEVIVSLRPDLVLTSPTPGNESAVRAIERTGVRVAVIRSEGGIEQALAGMLEVATAVGEAAKGEALVAVLAARLAAVREKATPLAHPVAAIVVGREPLVLAGPASYLGELLVLAGGVNVADAVGGRWPRVGLEYLVTSAPEVLLDLSVAMGEATATSDNDRVASWSTLASVPAVANGRVVTDPASVMLRPGPRLADAAEALFAALHPRVPQRAEPATP